MQILIATTNKGKIREYNNLLANAPVTLLSLVDVGLATMDVEETGDTFQANAELKAIAYAKASGLHALADDSGLCVDALGGVPGVHSARYAPGDDRARRLKLLGALQNADNRRAQFVCVIALADPNTLRCVFTEGVCTGQITHEDTEGTEGFGYDAIFMPEGYIQTFAQIPQVEKNTLSHRGRAAEKLVPVLRQMAGGG